ncbi:unnamed protein product [Bemisia tabaci]|uniref:Uncharacterized protein n=1 Tax=Bemisia tabaci TaxID=7038 RepID=A0A9P0F4D8_BEMTA|nr:unnamed protein product [Bemisia tabaci]
MIRVGKKLLMENCHPEKFVNNIFRRVLSNIGRPGSLTLITSSRLKKLGHDPCRRIGEAATGNNTHIVKYVHEMCGGYLRFFHMTPPEYHEHCPGAHEPKCMYHEKKWCCTVKINHRKLADPKPKDFKIVALTSCLATINNWDELVEQEVVTTEKDNYENLYN